jgi:hypothetical protein
MRSARPSCSLVSITLSEREKSSQPASGRRKGMPLSKRRERRSKIAFPSKKLTEGLPFKTHRY